MGRILSIDYGSKRTGLAVTDPLQIIASPLDTVNTEELFSYLDKYHKTEHVEAIVIGMPKNLNNQDTDSSEAVRKVIIKLKSSFDNLPIIEIDERFTSKMAFQTMLDGGLKKKARKNKGTIDKLSATIILQSYLQSKSTS